MMLVRCAGGAMFRVGLLVSFLAASLVTVLREQAAFTASSAVQHYYQNDVAASNGDWLLLKSSSPAATVVQLDPQNFNNSAPQGAQKKAVATDKDTIIGTANTSKAPAIAKKNETAVLSADAPPPSPTEKQQQKKKSSNGAATTRASVVQPGVRDNNGYREPLADIMATTPRMTGNVTRAGPGDANLPLPMRVIEEYKRLHSDDALRKNARGRTYAIGFYSCPYSAGNRLHEFFNDLLFSIVLNRTLLWKYPESNVTCRKYKLRCELLNAEEDCAAMVARAPWLPSYDQWAPALGLDKIRVRQLPPVRSFEFRRKEAQRKDKSLTNLTSNDFYKGQYKHVSGHVGVKNPLKLVAYGRDFLDLDWVSDEDRSKLPNPYAVYQAEKLYSLGKTFLYGMLHRYTFDFSRKIQDSLPKVRVDPTAFTVAIHSRHPNDRRIPPCDVTREIKCVRELLEHQSLYPRAEELGEGKSKNCTVFVLTDRECALDKMREWLEANTPCEVLIAPHEEGTGSRGEHGPFAGAGYFQDLAFASSGARHAMVASGGFARLLRTSSMTLLELIEYHRVVEAWKAGRRIPAKIGNVSLCILPM